MMLRRRWEWYCKETAKLPSMFTTFTIVGALQTFAFLESLKPMWSLWGKLKDEDDR